MSARTREACESGETLLEVMLAAALMGIAIVTIVGGLATAVAGSDTQRKQATAETVLRTAAEDIKSRGTAYIPLAGGGAGCSGTQYSLPAPPAGYTIAITAVQFWNKNTPATFTATCPISVAADPRVQRITLQAASTDGKTTQTIDIVKTPRDTNEVP